MPRPWPGSLNPREAGRVAATLLIAAAGGGLAHLLRLPLAWMIGPMLAVTAAGFAGLRAPPLTLGRVAALLVLGTAMGQTFTPPVLAAISAALPATIVGGLAAIGAGALVGRATARFAGSDAKTAFFASVPGGIVVMAVLAARAGADVAAVTLSQTVRMAMVVLMYPPALALAGARGEDFFTAVAVPVDPAGLVLLLGVGTAGALLLRRIDFANPWLLGALAVSLGLAAFGRPLSGVPAPVIDAAQLLMGASLGSRLSPEFLRRAPRLVATSIVSVLLLSALLVAAGVAIARAFDLPDAAIVLGMAPGGMPEMAITAKVMNLGVPVVLSFHLVRTLLCNLLVGPLWRVLSRWPG
jgi:membrane AbrB-like protein